MNLPEGHSVTWVKIHVIRNDHVRNNMDFPLLAPAARRTKGCLPGDKLKGDFLMKKWDQKNDLTKSKS